MLRKIIFFLALLARGFLSQELLTFVDNKDTLQDGRMVSMPERLKDRKTERQKDRKAERQKDRKTEKQKDRMTEIQKYRETERQKDT
jgi:hypothetical protein